MNDSLRTAASASTLIRSLHPRPTARRLFCFPYAGGGASAYRAWSELLGRQGVEVVSVQPPGREDRMRETPFDSVHPLADAVVRDIAAWLDRPFALFGHSLGALVAYEVAQRLQRLCLPQPSRLVVSARRAPQLALSHAPMHALPLRDLIEELRILGGTAPAVLDDPELMELFEPVIRADLKMTEHYSSPGRVPLSLPITALAGSADPRVSVAEVEAWQATTNGSFEQHVFDDGHFFIHSRCSEVLQLIAV